MSLQTSYALCVHLSTHHVGRKRERFSLAGCLGQFSPERPAYEDRADEIAEQALDNSNRPIALEGLIGAWCWTANANGRPAMVNIVRSA